MTIELPDRELIDQLVHPFNAGRELVDHDCHLIDDGNFLLLKSACHKREKAAWHFRLPFMQNLAACKRQLSAYSHRAFEK